MYKPYSLSYLKKNHSVPKLKATLAQKVELYKCLVETQTC